MICKWTNFELLNGRMHYAEFHDHEETFQVSGKWSFTVVLLYRYLYWYLYMTCTLLYSTLYFVLVVVLILLYFFGSDRWFYEVQRGLVPCTCTCRVERAREFELPTCAVERESVQRKVDLDLDCSLKASKLKGSFGADGYSRFLRHFLHTKHDIA